LLFELLLSKDHARHHLFILLLTLQSHLLFLSEFGEQLFDKFLLINAHPFHDGFCFNHIERDALLVNFRRLLELTHLLEELTKFLWCLVSVFHFLLRAYNDRLVALIGRRVLPLALLLYLLFYFFIEDNAVLVLCHQSL